MRDSFPTHRSRLAVSEVLARVLLLAACESHPTAADWVATQAPPGMYYLSATVADGLESAHVAVRVLSPMVGPPPSQ
jgi:hypothetical protein